MSKRICRKPQIEGGRAGVGGKMSLLTKQTFSHSKFQNKILSQINILKLNEGGFFLEISVQDKNKTPKHFDSTDFKNSR